MLLSERKSELGHLAWPKRRSSGGRPHRLSSRKHLSRSKVCVKSALQSARVDPHGRAGDGPGIGANAALFTVVRSVLFKPLPYKDPGSLVTLYQHDPSAKDQDKLCRRWQFC